MAMQYLGDGILAGRALYKYWKHVDGIRGDHSVASKLERATDDLLSDGLMRALLFTRCYRSPGLDQLFVEVSVSSRIFHFWYLVGIDITGISLPVYLYWGIFTVYLHRGVFYRDI